MLYLSRDRFDILRSELWRPDAGLSRRAPARRLLPEHGVLLQLPAALRPTLRCAAPTAIQTSLTTSISAWRPTRKSLVCCPQQRPNRPSKGDPSKWHYYPSTKTAPKPNLADLTVLAYGQTKIGKSTFCSNPRGRCSSPPSPGLNALDVFQVPIQSWDDLLKACAEITEGKHPFKTVIIDTIDNAYKFCTDYILKKFKIEHESDLGYGKGYGCQQRIPAGADQAGVPALRAVPGLPREGNRGGVAHRQVYARSCRPCPTRPGRSCSAWSTWCCSAIWRSTIGETANQRMRRVIRTKPSLYYEAGDRTGRLPETLDLDFTKFLEAFNTAVAPLQAASPR